MASGGGPIGVIGADERDVVFVSYARSNGSTVAPLIAALQSRGIRVWMDVADIRPATEWMHEIRAGITNARAVLALLSPEYFASSACRDELAIAHESGKSVIAIACADLDGVDVPAWLRALHWITWEPATDPSAAAAAVVASASADVAWSDLHSQLQGRAAEWARRGRGTSALLRGSELDEAERELALTRPEGQPVATALQRDYVVRSREHQRRNARRLFAGVSAVAVLAVVLAGVAIWQSAEAKRSAEESRRALARSDFERFGSAARTAPDQVRRARLALAAYAAADRAGLPSGASARPLIEALGNTDAPLAQFDIRPENQAYSGDHEGVAVSGDGSTLAFLGLDGILHVVDLWTMDEKASVKPAGWSGHYLPQVALSFDGTRVLYVAGDNEATGTLRVYEVEDGALSLESNSSLLLGGVIAAAAFGPSDETFTLVRVSGEIVTVRLTANEPAVAVLGEAVGRSSAGLMNVTFSRDANRVCLTGDARVLYQLAPPKLLASGDSLENCVPEPCSGSAANHVELDEDGFATCVEPGGAVVADIADCTVCDRPVDRAVVPGPTGDLTLDVGAGSIVVSRSSGGGLPEDETTVLPESGGPIWSSAGAAPVFPLASGEVVRPTEDGDFTAPSWAVVEAMADRPGQLLSTGEVASVVEGRLQVVTDDPADPELVLEGVQAEAWYGDLLAVGVGGKLEVWDLASREMVATEEMGGDVCAVGWSLGGTSLGAASCAADRAAAVTVWSLDGSSLTQVLDLQAPMPSAEHLSVSDDGVVVSISQTSGEIGIWDGSSWVVEPGLNQAAVQTNDYRAGWSMVDRTGSWLLARKNGEAMTLWSLADGGVTAAATLLELDPMELPVVAAFSEDELSLAWPETIAGAELAEPTVRRWDLSTDHLRPPLCELASATSLGMDRTGGGADRYADPCADWTRDLRERPVVEEPQVAVVPAGDPHRLRLNNLRRLEFGPDVGLETIAVETDRIPLVTLVGSHRVDVGLDDLEVWRNLRLVEEGGFNSAVVDRDTSDLIVSEWCGTTYRHDFEADTWRQLAFDTGENFVACNPIALAADTVWTVSGTGFVGVDDQGQRVEAAIPGELGTGFLKSLINVGPDALVALISPTDDGPPSLVHLDAADSSVSISDAPGLRGPLAVAPDDSLWAATEDGARLLRPDGTSEDVEFPDLGHVSAMAADSLGRLWFTTDTVIGVASSDGEVRFTTVPKAQGLSSIVFSASNSRLAALDSSTHTLFVFSMSDR